MLGDSQLQVPTLPFDLDRTMTETLFNCRSSLIEALGTSLRHQLTETVAASSRPKPCLLNGKDRSSLTFTLARGFDGEPPCQQKLRVSGFPGCRIVGTRGTDLKLRRKPATTREAFWLLVEQLLNCYYGHAFLLKLLLQTTAAMTPA